MRRRDRDLVDTHPLNPSAKSWAIRRVSISEQTPRCGVPKQRPPFSGGLAWDSRSCRNECFFACHGLARSIYTGSETSAVATMNMSIATASVR
jgi:hypothetical protein